MKVMKWVLPIAAALILILFITLMFTSQTMPQQNIKLQNGRADLTSANPYDNIVILSDEWQYYPGELFSPEDISSQKAGSPKEFTEEDESKYKVGTYRAELTVPEEGSYAISGWSLDYATSIYVNGQRALDVGKVSHDKSLFTPRIQYYTVPMNSMDNRIEVVIQYSNYVHYQGGKMQNIAFSSSENIEKYNNNNILPTYTLSGGLLLLAFFYFIQFFIYRKIEFVAFALCCALYALRSQQFVIAMLPLDYNWYILYRSFFIGSSLICLFFLLLAYFMFPGKFKKWVLPITFSLVIVIDMIVIAVPIHVASKLVMPAIVIAIPTILYFFIRLLTLLKRGRLSDRLAIIGMVIFLVTYIVEILFANSIPIITRMGVAPIGMILFVLCYMLSFNIRARENTAKLEHERQQTESLRKLGDMKTEFLANVTHELKTPLTVMSGYAQDTLAVIDESDKNIIDINFNQKQIIDESQRLNRIVDQLLDVAAIESGRMKLNKEYIDMGDLIRDILNVNFEHLNKNNNNLIINVEEDLPKLSIDAERIGQVFLNILSNAQKYTNNGEIRVNIESDLNNVIVSVKDNGQGMNEDVLNQVFKDYVRKESYTARSGIGLYISKKVVDAHKGTIEIDSHVGKGTEIRINLPREEESHG